MAQYIILFWSDFEGEYALDGHYGPQNGQYLRDGIGAKAQST
jgi:hypothetical protein